MKYIKVFTDFREVMQPLGDAEKGRLFDSALEYAEKGTEPQFRGNERFVWPVLKASIDRERATYERKASIARVNGTKNGRPILTDIGIDRCNIAQDKDKDKEKDYPPTPQRGAGVGGGGFLSEEEMTTLADGLSDVLDVAEQIGIPMSERMRDKLNLLVADYGAAAVLHGLDVIENQGKPTMAYLMGTLKGIRERGGDAPKPTSEPKFWRVTDDDC